jgi:hypothetical protein
MMERLKFAVAILFARDAVRVDRARKVFDEYSEIQRLKAERDRLWVQVEEAEERQKAAMWGEAVAP